MFSFCTNSKFNFLRCPISCGINSMSILAQSRNNRRSFNPSLLFEKNNYSFISWSGINNKQLNMVTFPPRPVDIHGIFFCLHPRRCFRNQPRLSMISGLGSRMYSQRLGGQAQHDLGAFNAFSPEIPNYERLLSFHCPIEFASASCGWQLLMSVNSMELRS